MHGLTVEETEVLKLLEDYGCLKESHIFQYFKNEKTGKYLDFLHRKGLIKRQDGLVSLRGVHSDANTIKAFEVLIHFKDELQDHWPATYPFTIYFMKKNKPYDVVVIPPGSELVLSAVITRSYAERVIAVIESMEQIDRIEIEKPVLFFIPDNPPKLYEKTVPQE